MNKNLCISIFLFVALMLPAIGVAMGPAADSLPDINASEAGGNKPSSPLKVTITPVYDAAYIPAGATVQMLVSVTSVSSVDNIKVTLRVTGGAELTAGDMRWTLSPVEAGVTYTRTVTVRFADGKAGKLTARAAMGKGAKGGGRYSASAFVSAQDKTGNKPDAINTGGRETIDGHGRKVIEYKEQ